MGRLVTSFSWFRLFLLAFLFSPWPEFSLGVVRALAGSGAALGASLPPPRTNMHCLDSTQPMPCTPPSSSTPSFPSASTLNLSGKSGAVSLTSSLFIRFERQAKIKKYLDMHLSLPLLDRVFFSLRCHVFDVTKFKQEFKNSFLTTVPG